MQWLDESVAKDRSGCAHVAEGMVRGSTGESNEIDGFKDTRCYAAIMDEAERCMYLCGEAIREIGTDGEDEIAVERVRVADEIAQRGGRHRT